jgi:hypothetical protein
MVILSSDVLTGQPGGVVTLGQPEWLLVEAWPLCVKLLSEWNLCAYGQGAQGFQEDPIREDFRAA